MRGISHSKDACGKLGKPEAFFRRGEEGADDDELQVWQTRTSLTLSLPTVDCLASLFTRYIFLFPEA